MREYGLSCIADGSVRAQTPTEGNSDTRYQNDKYKYFSTQKVTLENLSYRLTHIHVIYICTRLFTADLLKWQNGDQTKHLINRESSLDKLWYKHSMWILYSHEQILNKEYFYVLFWEDLQDILLSQVIRDKRRMYKAFQIWHKSEGKEDKTIYVHLFYIKNSG